MRVLKILLVLALLAVSGFAQGAAGTGQQTYTFRPTGTPPTPKCPYVRLYYNLSGQYCSVDCEGTVVCLGEGGGGSGPAAPANSVQFNNGAGGFGGDSGFLYFPDTDSAQLGTAADTTGVLTFYNSSNAFGVSLQAGTTSADVAFKLPIADGTAGQCLITDGAGQWSFSACGSGSGAPTNATYVTLSLNGSLTNERVLTAGTNITLNDAGANSTITINAVPTSPTSSVQINDAGVFGGDPGFLYTKATDTLSLGTSSSTTGKFVLRNATNTNTITVQAGTTSTSYNLKFPVADGTSGQCVATDGSGQWYFTTCGGGGGSSVLAVRETSINTALIPATDGVILVDTSGGNITVTLTTPGGGERRDFWIKKKTTDFNSITLSPASGNIDATGSHVFNGPIATSGETRHVVWDGTNWWIL